MSPKMERLSGIDATMLAVDTTRFTAYLGAVVVLDPASVPEGSLNLERFSALVESRLHLLPPFRRRLAEVPFGLGLPYWIDDDRFDLEFHLRESAIPAPGSPRQFSDMIARTFSRPLDRTRPLWEMWLVHGLEGGRIGLLTRFHHALVDGVSGNELFSILLDTSPEPEAVAPGDPWHPERPPSGARLLRSGLGQVARDSVGAARSVPSLLPMVTTLPGMNRVPGVRLARGVVDRLRGSGRDADVLELSGGLAPMTAFNGPLSAHRRYAYGELALDRIKAVKSSAEVTVNDVVVALCTTATRRWLLQNTDLPSDPLITAVPISIRGADDGYGNRIGMMTAPLATHLEDPLDRLAFTHRAMNSAKTRHGAIPADALTDVAAFIPPAVTALATRTALGVLSRVRPPVNLLISNVPGPREALFCAGAEMVGYFPVPPVIDGVGLNYTAVSYRDQLGVGIVTDRDQIADPFVLQEFLADALAELEDALP